MQHMRSINGRPRRRCARRAAARWLAGLCVACIGTFCLAAESMSGLGSAFRPQGWAEAPAAQKPAAGPDSTAGTPGLRVVVSSRGRSVASIDGQLVRVGDTVNNMRVTRIDTDGVTLAGKDGAREWLRVTPAVVKRPSTPNKTSRDSSGDHP